VLLHVRQRLGDDEVRCHLDLLRKPLRRHRDDVDRNRRADGERRDRTGEPALGEDARIEAARELAQLL
jgi:hypothetical protein